MTVQLFEKHRERLLEAVAACRRRGYHAAFAESPSPKIYGEEAEANGRAAFEARLQGRFELPGQSTTGGWIGAEESPWGIPLDIRYPAPDLTGMLRAAKGAILGWRDAGVEGRLGICLEILERLHRRSFELAYAVMHTTGQGFVMAFQAGGPHAQDRALEALAYSWEAMRFHPPEADWEKPIGRDRTERLRKIYTIQPRGVALVIACSTFPTWNAYPALFANLACGNPVLVKPHPRAVLPLAMTVETAREVLATHGYDPNIVQLVVDSEQEPLAARLATHPDIALVDYTGSSAFGNWLEEHARQATVFTEKSGINPVVIDSTADFDGMVRNLAFSLALYSGQMCTSPRLIFVPGGGIDSDRGHCSFDQVAQAIVGAVDALLADPARGAEILGCIQNPATLERVERLERAAGNAVLRTSTPYAHPRFPNARMRTPLLVHVESGDEDLYMQEAFGPIFFVIEADSTLDAIDRAARVARAKGAITALVHTTDESARRGMEAAMLEAGVALSENLTGSIYVNQAAAFSDYHVSGVNPSGNASLTDLAFVTPRFRIVQRRRPLA
ncbi:2-aminomuconic 6-semialdehyde dehydrogenase [bacterium HR40]|nr:2-aminomuconic 6-semialdehyde dehydrogenase [bacterium HR40]